MSGDARTIFLRETAAVLQDMELDSEERMELFRSVIAGDDRAAPLDEAEGNRLMMETLWAVVAACTRLGLRMAAGSGMPDGATRLQVVECLAGSLGDLALELRGESDEALTAATAGLERN